MRNALNLGRKRIIDLPRGKYFWIGDEIPDVRGARIFDYAQHSFNILEDMDYAKASYFVDVIDCLFDRGESTLTKDTGLDFIFDALEAEPKSLETLIELPDKKSTPGHIWAYSKIRRILRSPILRSVLCKPTNFSFTEGRRTVILARVNRAEMTDFDARALVYFLLGQYHGQLVLPNGGYLRDVHVQLLNEGRLIVGLNAMSEVAGEKRLHDALEMVEDKEGHGCLFRDAEMLAMYQGLRPDPSISECKYNIAVREAMA